MVRGILLFFFLFLICGHNQVTSTVYHLEDAIEDLNFFIPGSKLALTTAIKLWSVYGEVRQMIDPNSTVIEEHLQKIDGALSTISDQLDDISGQLGTISDDVKDVKELVNDKVINQLPKEFNLETKKSAIYKEISKVNSLFEKSFRKYNNASKKYENATLLNFADSVVDHGLNELPSVLERIHSILRDEYENINMLNIMTNKRLASIMMCKRHESAQHSINKLYKNIMDVEMKGLLMTQFAYSIKNLFSNSSTSYLTELEDARNEFYSRTSKTIAEIKRAMYHAPRDFWSCDPEIHTQDFTYAKLAPIFQAYVISEKDAGISRYLKKFRNKCSDTCTERSNFYDLCRSKHCRKHERKCSGKVHDCKPSGKELHICMADKNSSRRYEYIVLHKDKEDSNKEVLGSMKSCGSNTTTVTKSSHFLMPECDYCFCTCENININMYRYFSLKNVTSDVQSNNVVTGVRFAKKNNMFHIQIQQGQLLKNGNINVSTVQWQSVDEFTVHDRYAVLRQDYHNITWFDRTVHLDSIDSPLNNVLTGLRFRSEKDYIKLEIQITPFNFYTGELKKNESTWIFNSDNAYERTELKLDNLNVATSTNTNFLDSSNYQYIKFTTSSLKTDIGQNVVPFVDLQIVTSSPPVPLSGAGLIHKGNKESAGFLSFKLFTYNYAPYLQN